MSDPFLLRQTACIGAVMLGIGLVGCAARRHVVPFSLGLGLALQGLVVFSAGVLRASSGLPEYLLILVVACGSVAILAVAAADEGCRGRRTDLVDEPAEAPNVDDRAASVVDDGVASPADLLEATARLLDEHETDGGAR